MVNPTFIINMITKTGIFLYKIDRTEKTHNHNTIQLVEMKLNFPLFVTIACSVQGIFVQTIRSCLTFIFPCV